MTDPRAISRAIGGTLLGDRTVRSLRIPAFDEVAFVIDIDARETRPAWRVLRDRVDVTGRWPVVVTDWSGCAVVSDDVLDRYGWSGDERSAETVLRVGERLRPERALERFSVSPEEFAVEWAEIVEDELDATREQYGDAPDDKALLALRGDYLELERRLFAYEERLRPTTTPVPGAHLDWFTPQREACAVLLVPDARPESAPAFVSFFGADREGGHAALMAIMRHWNERYGAELVASWSTMLQFIVHRPPQDIASAFELAVEHYRVAPCTTHLPRVSIRNHARALLDRHNWFLHERP